MDDIISRFDRPLTLISVFNIVYFTLNILRFALLTLIAVMPVLALTFTYLASLRKGILKQSDRRVKLMNEILSGIKIIKLYCWDIAFADKVQGVRVDEVKLLAKLGVLVLLG